MARGIKKAMKKKKTGAKGKGISAASKVMKKAKKKKR